MRDDEHRWTVTVCDPQERRGHSLGGVMRLGPMIVFGEQWDDSYYMRSRCELSAIPFPLVDEAPPERRPARGERDRCAGTGRLARRARP